MKEREAFYTAEPKMKKVSEEEFLAFIKNYPRTLEADVCGWMGPPVIVTYNDFQLANRWPDSIVARANREDHIFWIVENYEELFASKTGYEAGGKE